MKLPSKFFLACALMLPTLISFASGEPCVKTNYDGKVVFEGTTNYSGVCERTTEQSNTKFFKGKNYSSSIEIKYSRPIWTSMDNKIDCCSDEGKKARLASYKSCMAKSEKTSMNINEREADCATACVAYGIFSLTPRADEQCVPSKVRWQAGHRDVHFEGTVWQDIYMLETATTYRAKGIVDEFAPAIGLNTEHNPTRIGYGYSPEHEPKSEKRTRLLEAHIVKE